MGRTSFSSKQTAMPSWVAMRIFLVPSVSRTEISSSPSSICMARMPLLRMFFRAVTGRRFTVPFRVTMTRKRSSSSMDRVWIMAWIRSPCSTWRMLTMLVPLAVLPDSGIW